MKRIWTLFLLLLSTAVFLAACSTSPTAEAVPPVEAAAPGSVAPTATAAAAVETVSEDTSELSQIGQTGRPQLLNAYASW